VVHGPPKGIAIAIPAQAGGAIYRFGRVSMYADSC
jgi:hypothetical protein